MNSVDVQLNRASISRRSDAKSNKKICELHGKKGHSTEECLTLNKISKMGCMRKNSTANCIETEDHLEKQKLNGSFYYSFNFLKTCKNLFLMTGTLQSIPILIDTGADPSLVSKYLLSSQTALKKTAQTTRSANGSPIPILSILENIPLQINNKEISIKRL